ACIEAPQRLSRVELGRSCQNNRIDVGSLQHALEAVPDVLDSMSGGEFSRLRSICTDDRDKLRLSTTAQSNRVPLPDRPGSDERYPNHKRAPARMSVLLSKPGPKSAPCLRL